MFFYCQSLGRLTERKPLCTPHLMDYPQAAGLGDRAEQEDHCRLFSWLKRRFDSRLTLMKWRPSYAFETSAPFTAFKCTQASAVLCFAEPSRVQMWKKDARAGVSLSWQELKVCWGEPERRWKCFVKKGNGGWKSTVAETMTTPIIPVIVVAERALYNIIQGGSDTPQQSRWWKKYSHALHSGRGRHPCHDRDIRHEGKLKENVVRSAALSGNLYKNTALHFFLSECHHTAAFSNSPRRLGEVITAARRW